MPELVAPERASFTIDADGTPVVSLAVDQPDLGVVDGSVLPDWRILARSTLTVVDGPRDTGFLVPGDPRQISQAKWWMRAVETRGGAVVRFVGAGQQPVDSLPSDGAWPGGFVRVAD